MWDDYKSFFKDKKVTLMGLGLLGRGIGDAAFLAGLGAALTVTDLKSADDLASSVEQLKHFDNITFVLGEHREEDFSSADMIIKGAGVPLQNKYIQAAQDAGVPVYMSTALFAKFAREQFGVKVIGVTGTRGKSTVAQMIYEMMKDSGGDVTLGGNVRGMSTLATLDGIKPGSAVVLELDSWQLQGFRGLKISPDLAVFTNLMPDHMDYYKDDMQAYFHDKAAIFEHQKADDVLIVGADVAEQVKGAHPEVVPIVPDDLPEDWSVGVPGAHNRENAALAMETARSLNVPDAKIRKTLTAYCGLEGRLELLGEIGGVRIYNDTNATTPAASLAAIQSFDLGTVLLIAGGAEKGLPIEDWVDCMKTQVKKTVFLKGTGTERISKEMPGVAVFENLQDAFSSLMDSAQGGDVLLLSPGFASFGMFKNEYDRGDQFKALVQDQMKPKAASL